MSADPDDPRVRVQRVPIETLRGQERNYREHNPRNLGLIGDSVQEFGMLRSIVADETGEVFAGSGTLEAAMERGITEALVIDTPGDVLVVHRRSGLTAEQKERASIADNLSTDTSTMNLAMLAEAARARPALLDGLYSPQERIGLLEAAAKANQAALRAQAGGGGDEFETTAPVEPRTRSGEIWALGNDGQHRLIVGDCTDPAVWTRLRPHGTPYALVFTSPPYNAAAKSNLPNKVKYQTEAADDQSPEAYLRLLTAFTTLALRHAQYVLVNVQQLAGNKRPLAEWIYTFREQWAETLIWDKEVGEPAMAINVCNSQWEYVQVFSAAGNRVIGTRPFRGTEPNLVRIPSRREKEYADQHRATFPLAVPTYFLSHFMQPGERGIDPFCGTGTSIIAADRLGMVWDGIEKEPAYADLILERAEAENLPCWRLAGPDEEIPDA